MKIYLFINNLNIVYGYHITRTSPEDIEFTTNNLAWIVEHLGSLKYIDGELIEIDHSQDIDLRTLRRKECFSIINRGKLWYDSLTEQQLAELSTWYQAWLDVTETFDIPNKPSFL